MLRHLFLAITFFLSSPVSLFALDIPKQPEGYVSDYAKLLSDLKRARLEQTLRDFEDKTGNQVLVAIFPRLGGDSLENYSIRLAEAWKPGQKGKDNGAILLIFKEDRKVRIEVGYGLEGMLTDALCKLIIENEIVPRFRAGDYDGGVEQGVTAILSATRGDYPFSSRSNSSREGGGSFYLALLMTLFIFQAFIFLRRSTSTFARSSGFSRRGYYWGWGYGGSGWGSFGGDSGFGGGGFSGGGGGFGGGGASGSW